MAHCKVSKSAILRGWPKCWLLAWYRKPATSNGRLCDSLALLLCALILPSLFRIEQEALTNAIRHSQTQQVFISLDQPGDAVRLVIRDNGIGIQTRSPERISQRPRLGLLGMKERTALLGGTFDVQSTPGEGTTVSVEVPLKPAPLADA